MTATDHGNAQPPVGLSRDDGSEPPAGSEKGDPPVNPTVRVGVTTRAGASQHGCTDTAATVTDSAGVPPRPSVEQLHKTLNAEVKAPAGEERGLISVLARLPALHALLDPGVGCMLLGAQPYVSTNDAFFRPFRENGGVVFNVSNSGDFWKCEEGITVIVSALSCGYLYSASSSV